MTDEVWSGESPPTPQRVDPGAIGVHSPARYPELSRRTTYVNRVHPGPTSVPVLPDSTSIGAPTTHVADRTSRPVFPSVVPVPSEAWYSSFPSHSGLDVGDGVLFQ